MREQLQFSFLYRPTLTQTSGSNRREKPLGWPVAPAVILLQKQCLYSQRSAPPGSGPQKYTYTQLACTLALLLMLMPRSILLSSCKQRHRQVAPHHFNTLTGPRYKTAHLAPRMEDRRYTEDLLACKQAITEASLYFLLSPISLQKWPPLQKRREKKQNRSKSVSMIPPVPVGKGQACLNKQSW